MTIDIYYLNLKSYFQLLDTKKSFLNSKKSHEKTSKNTFSFKKSSIETFLFIKISLSNIKKQKKTLLRAEFQKFLPKPTSQHEKLENEKSTLLGITYSRDIKEKDGTKKLKRAMMCIMKKSFDGAKKALLLSKTSHPFMLQVYYVMLYSFVNCQRNEKLINCYGIFHFFSILLFFFHSCSHNFFFLYMCSYT